MRGYGRSSLGEVRGSRFSDGSGGEEQAEPRSVKTCFFLPFREEEVVVSALSGVTDYGIY